MTTFEIVLAIIVGLCGLGAAAFLTYDIHKEAFLPRWLYLFPVAMLLVVIWMVVALLEIA